MSTNNQLSNLQLELLKMFKYELSDEQLLEIKSMLAKYFADKATKEMDRLWEENGWTNETMKAWGQEHMRSSGK